MDRFVYAAASGDYVKIGHSADPATRLTQIPSTVVWPVDLHPSTPIEMVGHTEGGRQAEQRLHREFAEWRVAGEWFRRSDQVEAWLATLTPGCPEVVRSQVVVRVEDSTLARIEQLARDEGRTRSDVFRRLLWEAIHERDAADTAARVAKGGT